MFAAALLLLRRHWPLMSFGACLLVYCTTVLIGFSSLGAGIATIIAGFGVANRMARRTAFLAGAIGATVVTVLSVTVAELGVVDPRVFQIAAGIAIAIALGDSTRSRREYVVAITERAERAEQTREAEAHRRVAEDRLRIAQDLHDTVAHQISVISLNAGVATGALSDRPEKAREALGTIRTAARGVLFEIGELLRYLRTNEEVALVKPPQVGLQHLDSLVQRISAAGLRVETQIDGDLERVTGATDLVAYRIVQEGLTNAHKHGAGHTARVTIQVGEESAQIAIVNWVAPSQMSRAEHVGDQWGLIGIRERVATIGGTVRAQPVDNQFWLTADLPLSRGARA